MDESCRTRNLHVGTLAHPRRRRLHGGITDRDIVVKGITGRRDPQTVTAHELAQGTPMWVDAPADTRDVLRLMDEHEIRGCRCGQPSPRRDDRRSRPHPPT